MIKAILVCDSDGGVSRGGTIPTKQKDLRWFKHDRQCCGHGLKTWIDPLMPWPYHRINVLATSKEREHPGADKYICGDLPSELKKLKEEYTNKTIWVIGGPNIIEQTIESIEEFYLSRILGSIITTAFCLWKT